MSLPATNPKKRALMPSTPLRKQLRAAAHALDPIVQLGKTGVSDAVLKQVSDALDHHELVKVKVGSECPADRFEVADALAALPRTHVAQVLGRMVLAYRKKRKDPRFEPGVRDDAKA